MGCGQSKIHLYPRKSKSKANGKKGGHVESDEADEEEGHIGEEGGEKDINRDKDHRINNDDASPSDEKDSSETNGEISISLIRAKNLSLLQSQEISSSQQNFFRMLDQKIEDGPDYDSNSETEIALEEARLNTLVQHWESASLTASLCSSASRSLQTTPVRQVQINRQQPQLPLRAAMNSIAALQQPLNADLLSHHGISNSTASSTVVMAPPGMVMNQHQLMQQQHQQQQLLLMQQQQQQQQQQSGHMIVGMGGVMIPISGSPQQAQLLSKTVSMNSPKRVGGPVTDPRNIVLQQTQIGSQLHQPYGVVVGTPSQQQQQQQQMLTTQLQQQQQQQLMLSGGGGVRPPRPGTPQMVNVGPGTVIPTHMQMGATYYGQPPPQGYFGEVLHPMQVPQPTPEYRFPPAISVQRLAPQVQRQLRETQELIKDSCPQLYAAGYGSPGPPLRNQPRNSRRPPTLETQYSTELS